MRPLDDHGLILEDPVIDDYGHRPRRDEQVRADASW